MPMAWVGKNLGSNSKPLLLWAALYQGLPFKAVVQFLACLNAMAMSHSQQLNTSSEPQEKRWNFVILLLLNFKRTPANETGRALNCNVPIFFFDYIRERQSQKRVHKAKTWRVKATRPTFAAL